jgi:ABC-2 type transport system permease protein
MALLLLLTALVCNALLALVKAGPVPPLEGPVGKGALLTSLGGVVYLYLLHCIEALAFGTIAFMLSALSQSSAIATGVTFFALFLGPEVTRLIFPQSIARYVLFSHTDLTGFIKVNPLRPEASGLWFSLLIVAGYLFVFYALSWLVFKRRDILK